MKPYLPYAGIGSQKTPFDVCEQMTEYAARLESIGFTLRSGAANGADTAFEAGVMSPDNKEIFLPWKGFNASDSRYWEFPDPETKKKAQEIAAKFHPWWNSLSNGVKALHTRNVAQVLGHSLKSPSKFVICWTHNGARGGGTGQALRIAEALNIPIFDLGLPGRWYVEQSIEEMIEEYKYAA